MIITSLIITVVGMLVVFSFLLLLVGIMKAFSAIVVRYFTETKLAAVPVQSGEGSTSDAEIAVAIAAAYDRRA